jgi:hypothetical protein
MGIAWAIAGTCASIIISLGAGLMTMPGTSTHVAACIAFLLPGMGILITAAIWWRRHPTRDWTVHMRAGGLALLVFIATPTMLWFAWPADAQIGSVPPAIQQNNQGAPNIIAPGNNNQFNFAPQHSEAPHDNTFAGQVPPSVAETLSQGHDNTYAGATDSHGNAIYGGGTVIGSHACGGPTSSVIGSHANGGAC